MGVNKRFKARWTDNFTWWLEEGDINKTSSPPPVLFKIIKESA